MQVARQRSDDRPIFSQKWWQSVSDERLTTKVPGLGQVAPDPKGLVTIASGLVKAFAWRAARGESTSIFTLLPG